ncbi:MAG: LysM peptidoglycan-binding domain-containing protein [Burkholderiales bacterium]|nr:LysM peptidoglycan-binding domain-containing protein [Burkholderiales bacterium]
MGKAIIYLVLSTIAALLAPGLATAQDTQSTEPLALVENPPSRYVVVEGDTLWDISARFLRDPWRWPDIWGLNRDEVKNPHWIYPGDVLILDFSGATPRLRFESDTGWTLVRQRLSPQIRTSPLDSSPIPTISRSVLKSLLSSTLLVGANELEAAPTIVAGRDGRVLLGPGDVAYASGLQEKGGKRFYAVRPGRSFTDPDTKEVLGYEAIYLGDTSVTARADVSTLKISRAVREINPGDRLMKMTGLADIPYMPRPPSRSINGKVIASAEEGVSEIGPLTVVVLNRGSRDGVETGNVLELYRTGEHVQQPGSTGSQNKLRLPDERYGVVFVFRVYERLSYALVMNTTRSVQINDFVLTPS